MEALLILQTGLIMATIQFKRTFNYTGSFDDALYNIKNHLTPPLADGEPLMCSYTDGDELRFFIAIGAGDGVVKIYPVFDGQEDFCDYLKKHLDIEIDLSKMISYDSDLIVSLDQSTNEHTIKIKEEVLNVNWKQL